MKLSDETKAKLAAIKSARENKSRKLTSVYKKYLEEHNGKVALSTALDKTSIAAEFLNFSFAGIISDSCNEAYMLISADKYGHLAISKYLGRKKDDLPGFIKFRVSGNGVVHAETSYVDKHGNFTNIGNEEWQFFERTVTEKILAKLYEMAPSELINPRYSYIFDGVRLIELQGESESMRPVIIRTIANENGLKGGLESLEFDELLEFEEMEREFY